MEMLCFDFAHGDVKYAVMRRFTRFVEGMLVFSVVY